VKEATVNEARGFMSQNRPILFSDNFLLWAPSEQEAMFGSDRNR